MSCFIRIPTKILNDIQMKNLYKWEEKCPNMAYMTIKPLRVKSFFGKNRA